MRLRNVKRKAIGLSLSATALAGVGLMSYAGDLPIHLADYTSSTSQVQLPAATDATANVPPGEIFGLCTAYLNHVSGEATTSTTSPSSTTTTSPSSTTTTSASTTTTSSSSSTTSSTGASSTTSSSTTASDQDNLKVPLVLTNAAKAKGETVLQLCAAVNPQHAKLKLFEAVKVDSDDTTTTTVAPTTTTTSAPTTTTTGASSSSLKDDSHTNVSSSAKNDNSDTQQKSSGQSVFGSDHSNSSGNGSIDLNLNTHFNAHAKVSGNQG